MELVIFASVIDAHEEIEVAIVDIPNEFIQTNNTNKIGNQRYMMKIRDKLAEILVEIALEVYEPYITYENGKSVIYL